MDREKAIQILKRCEAESYCSHYKRHYCCIGCGQREALDLAIEALSDMSEEEVDYCNNCPYISYNEDCISRQDAIYALTGWETEHLEGDIKRTLENLPPVTPTDSEDCISRDWIIAYCNSKVEHYRQRLKRIEKEGENITYDPETQIERFKDEIAIYESFAREMQDAPSVTPTERTGEWISLFDGNEWSVHCSKCKTQHYEEDLLMGGSELPNFCPNCGAKMGGMDNEV